MPFCKDCRFFYADNRVMKYRRQPMFFCNRKGAFHSRNFRIGEGSRIDKDDTACSLFEPCKGKASSAPVYVEKDDESPI